MNNSNGICSKPLSILTVGDGDLSASLAILRAYHSCSSIATTTTVTLSHITATTLLPSQEDLIATYPTSAEAILSELLESKSVTVLFRVDATQLHNHNALRHRKFDLVLFHYPHLGYTQGMSSEEHAARHSSLLSGYFYSAQAVLSEGGLLHVCLTSGAVQSWGLDDIVQQLNMKVVLESPASRPLLEPLLEHLQQSSNDENPSTASTKRATKGGSRRGHWLGRHGYRHQPTFPDATEFQTNVSSSYHYFLRPLLLDRDSYPTNAMTHSNTGMPTQKN